MDITVTDRHVQLAQRGDRNAIQAIYDRFNLGIYRYLYYQVGDIQTAEDLTSEVFVRMIRSLPGFQPRESPFQAWLYQIARNLAIDHFRKATHRNHVELKENDIVQQEDMDKTVERHLTQEQLQKALARLNSDQRDVILLRFVNGLSINEVARSLDKSEDAIKGLQRRALSSLREILDEWEVSYV